MLDIEDIQQTLNISALLAEYKEHGIFEVKVTLETTDMGNLVEDKGARTKT
jgi:hypothetical protein